MTAHALDALNALIYHPPQSTLFCSFLLSGMMQKARACGEDRKPVHSVHSLHGGVFRTTDFTDQPTVLHRASTVLQARSQAGVTP